MTSGAATVCPSRGQFRNKNHLAQDRNKRSQTENRKPMENDEQHGAIKTGPEVKVQFLFLIILITCH